MESVWSAPLGGTLLTWGVVLGILKPLPWVPIPTSIWASRAEFAPTGTTIFVILWLGLELSWFCDLRPAI